MPFGEEPARFELPRDAGSIRRVDVQVATYLRPATGPLRLSLRDAAGIRQRSAEVIAADVGDNGWVAFDIDPAWRPTDGAFGEVVGVEGEHSAPYVDHSGALCIRTWHQPPVPPDRPTDFDISEEYGTARKNLPPVGILLICVTVVAVIAAAYVLTHRAHTVNAGSIDDVVAVQLPGQETIMAAVNVSIHNN